NCPFASATTNIFRADIKTMLPINASIPSDQLITSVSPKKHYIVKIYLKGKKKPIIIVFKKDLSNFAKLLNELGYRELLTRKNF
ncbi:hypothetical protein LMS36_10125, partial [Clostridium perfringens]|nr:hypothetical protein [Clostridium perfringens]